MKTATCSITTQHVVMPQNDLPAAVLALLYAMWRTCTPEQLESMDAQLRPVAQALEPLVAQVTDKA